MRKNNSKASQGGLTSPKLYDSGPDFPNRSRKRWNGRHVRISCINVTKTLSSVVIISHPNQLQYCHTRKISGSQVLHKCFTESVAEMSLLQICQSSVVFMFSANRCRNVTVAKMSRQEAKMSQLRKYHRPHQWKMRVTPPVENDPSEGIRDHQWK